MTSSGFHDISITHFAYPSLEHVIEKHSQENYSLEEMIEKMELATPIDISLADQSTTIEIHPGKTLNINSHLDTSQHDQLMKVLQTHSQAFAWDYVT
jgi:hypothetical protein